MALTVRSTLGWANLLLVTLVALAIWVLGSVLFTRHGMRKLFDVSPQARFSVEPATAELLDSLNDPDGPAQGAKLELHTIFRPLIRPSGRQLTQETELQYQTGVRLQNLTRDLLRQYDYLGAEAVIVKHHDPRYDIEAIREVVQAIKALGNQMYGSVIVKLGRRSKVLSLRDELAVFETTLDRNPDGSPTRDNAFQRMVDFKGEEAVSTAIKRLLVEGTPKLYVDVGSASGGTLIDPFAGSHSTLLTALKDDGFEIQGFDLRTDESIPEDADVVALFEVKRMLPREADALLAFCRRGGRVLVTAPWFEVPASWNQPLEELGSRFGFEVGTSLVAQLIQDPSNPDIRRGGIQSRAVLVKSLNPTHPITRPLVQANRPLSFADCRAVRRLSEGIPEGVRVDPSLVLTDAFSWIEERTAPGPAGDLIPDYHPPAGAGREIYSPRAIAAIADVDPTEEGTRTGGLFLLAARGLDNKGFQINGDFALNVFNWLAERDALLSIRGRSYVPRKIDLTPQQADRVFWLLVVGVPGLLFLLGIVVFWRRSRH